MAFALNVILKPMLDPTALAAIKKQLVGITALPATTKPIVPLQLGDVGKQTIQIQGMAQALGVASVAAQKTSSHLGILGGSLTKTGKATTSVAKGLKTAGTAATGFGHSVALAGKRYAAFLAATVVPFAVIGVFGKATKSVIEFDKSLVGLSQIMNKTMPEMDEMRKIMLNLAVQTGTSQQEIGQIAKTLAQAGILAKQGSEGIKAFLEPLAKVPLVATFENTATATDAVIAALNQFRDSGLTATDVLDKLTNVSKQYAVSSEDLAQGIKRAGGAFAAVGGTFDELIAALTTIRSVTRESATVVGTSLRTITTRLRRLATIRFLEGMDIEVRNLRTGELLPFIQTIQNIEKAFRNANLETKNLIATQLGGFRQISRVFALVRAPEVLAGSFEASRTAFGAFNKDAQKGLQALDVQIGRLVGQFNQLAQSLAEPVFVPFIQALISIGKAAVFVIGALKPILPIITQLVAAAVGIKALSVALAAIPKSLAAISAVKLAGLSALAGRGGAAGLGAAQPLYGGPAIAGFAAGTAGAQQGRFGRGAGAFARSQLGQFAGLIALNAIAGKVAESFEEVESSSIKLAAETIKTATIMVGVASLLTGRTATGLFARQAGGMAAGLFAPIGLGLTAGLTALGFAVRTETEANIDKIINKYSAELQKIDPDISSVEKINESLGEFGAKFTEAIKEAADQFDFSVEGGHAIKGFLRSFFKRAEGLFTGNFEELFGPALGTEDIKGIADKLIASNAAVLNQLVTSTIEEFGGDFKGALDSGLAALIPQLGADPVYAKLFRERLIKQYGGAPAIISARKQAIETRARQALADATEEVTARFRELHRPLKIASDLDKFKYAIDQVTRAIENNIKIFEGLTGVIGQIDAPRLGAPEWDLTEVLKGLTPEAVSQLIGIPGFEELGGAAADLGQIYKLTEEFIKSFTASELAAKLETGKAIQPFEAITAFTEDYYKKIESEVPEHLRGIMKNLLGQIGNAVEAEFRETKTLIDTDEIRETIGRLIGKAGLEIGESTGEGLIQFLDNFYKQIDLDIRAKALRAQKRVEKAETPERFYELFANTSAKMSEAIGGLYFETYDSERGFTPTAKRWGQAMKNIALSTQYMPDLARKYENALTRQGEAFRGFTEAQDAVARTDYATQFHKATLEVLNLKEHIALLAQGTGAASGLIRQKMEEIKATEIVPKDESRLQQRMAERRKYRQEQELKNLERQLKEVDRLAEAIGRLEEIEVEVGIEVSDAEIMNTAATTFRTAVIDYEKATATLLGFVEKLKPTAKEAKEAKLIESREVTINADKSIVTEAGRIEPPTPPIYEKPEEARIIEQYAFGDDIRQIQASLWEELTARRGMVQTFKDFTKQADAEFSGTWAELIDVLGPEKMAAGIGAVVETLKEKAKEAEIDVFQVPGAEAAITKNLEKFVQQLATGAEIKVELPQKALDFLNVIRREQAGQAPLEAREEGPLFEEVRSTAQELDSSARTLDQAAKDAQISMDKFQNVEATAIQLGTSAETLGQNVGSAADRFQETEVIAKDLGISTELLGQATESAGIAVDGLRFGAEDLSSSAGTLNTSIQNLGITVDELRAALGVTPTAPTQLIPEITAGGESVSPEMNEAIRNLDQSMNNLMNSIETQTQATQEQTTKAGEATEEPLTIEGLKESEEAVEQNTQALNQTNTTTTELNTQLAQTKASLDEGLDVKIEAIQQLDLDIRGLEDAVEELKPEFEEVARKAAKEIVREAVHQLANAANTSSERHKLKDIEDSFV